MAKKKPLPGNIVEESFNSGYESEPEAKVETETINIPPLNPTQEYTPFNAEKRSKRLQIIVKPSIGKKLDQYVNEGIIKNKNDLINFLLETWIAEQEAK